MSGFVSWLQQLRFDGLFSTGLIVLASLLCITVHETCHGLVAYWLGDPTAKRAGRLTLNPIRHVDLMGLIMMAVLQFGWAKPVPVDMRHFKHPKRDMALTALAGPLSNVLLALLALIVRNVLLFFLLQSANGFLSYGVELFEYVTIISTGLAVFNLIPIPPLDGSKILAAVLPSAWYYKLLRLERYGMVLLVVIMFAGWLDLPLYYLRDGLLGFLERITAFPFYWLCELFL